MHIKKFKECNITFAENQQEYLPLQAYRSEDGEVISCWSMSFRERVKVLFTGKVYLRILTFNHPLQPQKMEVDSPFVSS